MRKNIPITHHGVKQFFFHLSLSISVLFLLFLRFTIWRLVCLFGIFFYRRWPSFISSFDTRPWAFVSIPALLQIPRAASTSGGATRRPPGRRRRVAKDWRSAWRRNKSEAKTPKTQRKWKQKGRWGRWRWRTCRGRSSCFCWGWLPGRSPSWPRWSLLGVWTGSDASRAEGTNRKEHWEEERRWNEIT